MFGIVIARNLDSGEFVGIYSKSEEKALLRSGLRLVVSDLCSVGALEYIVENNNLESNIDNLRRTVKVLESSEETLGSPVLAKFINRVKPRILKDILENSDEEQLEDLEKTIINFKGSTNDIGALAIDINGISFPLDLLKSVYKELVI